LEKLLVIKEFGATRISINPQTMNDSVLKAIGRNHTAKQTKEAFLLARECGFNNINTDLIAGLPNDDFRSFSRSLDGILRLEPENITVHTFCVKKSADILRRFYYLMNSL
jgi:oxygen-independent coproporphyrinogen-3 oxidase